jgi:glycosyltransferase involved in cell wall biosynthesis
MGFGMTARVSICLPAYNHGRFLGAAIQSALAQTYSDIEVIVSDNRSTDDTAQVVAALAKEDARIRYERAPQHVGMAENFNRCLALARGEYIKFLCADDLLEPQCVARLLEAMEGSKAVLAGCGRYLVDESSSATVGVARFARRDWAGPGAEAARRCFFLGNLIGEPTAVMFRRDAGEAFNTRYSQLVDLDLWFRLLERGRFAFVAAPLCRIRRHPAQATHASAASGRITGDKAQLFRDYAWRPHMRGNTAQRLTWDFRMAWSLQRESAAHGGGGLADALFYPKLWRAMLAGAAFARRIRPAA